jgi:predicted lipoprotein with Yx(FWY)xxD motif
MARQLRRVGARVRRPTVGLIVALAGCATAATVAVAVAKTFTLNIAKNAQVTNTAGVRTRENVVVNSRGFAVYALSGDSMHHPKCTKANGCFTFWPPLEVASAKSLSKASAISGKLAVWRRDGFFQVTLAGHPLYKFSGDKHRDAATGEGLRSFHGTWHVSTTPSTKTTTTPAGTTTTPYPPGY